MMLPGSGGCRSEYTNKENTMAIKVNTAKCTGCGACISTCPVEVLEMKGGKAVYKGDGCIECGACVAACPVEALSL
jgi:NAD-dependent dihydropyrimidine dehydrogenase PreA subunit